MARPLTFDVACVSDGLNQAWANYGTGGHMQPIKLKLEEIISIIIHFFCVHFNKDTDFVVTLLF